MKKRTTACLLLSMLLLFVCAFVSADGDAPVFIPGDLGNDPKQKGHLHTAEHKYVSENDDTHDLLTFCTDCGEVLEKKTEAHAYKDGVCAACHHNCAHTKKVIEHLPANTAARWDGKYLYRKYLRITSCQSCGTELGREETELKTLHTEHTGAHDSYAPCNGYQHYDRMYCTDCGLAYSVYEDHEWVFDGEKADESNETHILSYHCEKCGEIKEDREAHALDTVSFRDTGDPEEHAALANCTVCGAENREIALPHAWEFDSLKEAGGPEGHIAVFKCKDCGALKEEQMPHEWAHYAYAENGDTEKHEEILKCTVCGATKTEQGAHDPVHLCWNEFSDTQHEELVRCKICGQAYTKEPVAHVYYSKKQIYESNGSETHSTYQFCEKCGHVDRGSPTKTEAHNFSKKGYCFYCNQPVTEHRHKIGLNFPSWTALDETYHCPRQLCPVCGVFYQDTDNKEPHDIDLVTGKCRVCGYLLDHCEHEYGEYKADPFGSITKEGHVLKAQCMKCGMWRTVTAAHTLRYEKMPGTGMHRVVCEVCGYNRTELHENVNWACQKCGARLVARDW